jgi:hypothetical protein
MLHSLDGLHAASKVERFSMLSCQFCNDLMPVSEAAADLLVYHFGSRHNIDENMAVLVDKILITRVLRPVFNFAPRVKFLSPGVKFFSRGDYPLFTPSFF